MNTRLTICLALAVVLALTLTSATNGQEFVGDESPIVVDIQGRVQRKSRLIRYTPKFRVRGSEPLRRLQSGLCKSLRFRLVRPRFLQDALLNCTLVTVSWDVPWVTLRVTFNRRIIVERGITAGCLSFYTLLRANLEKYHVCDCPDAFTGRLYIGHSCELLKVAAVEIQATTMAKMTVNHSLFATEILNRFPPVYGLKEAFRGVFLLSAVKLQEDVSFTYKFYFSEHVLALYEVDIYCHDFLAIGNILLLPDIKGSNKDLHKATITRIDRAHEDFLNMRQLLKLSTELPTQIRLDFIPDNVLCNRMAKWKCKR